MTPLENLINIPILQDSPQYYDFSGVTYPIDRVLARQYGPIGFWSEQQLFQAIAFSRFLCERNPLANGFLEQLVNFIGQPQVIWTIRTGSTAKYKKKLLKKVESLWNIFEQYNNLGPHIGPYSKAENCQDREKEIRKRIIRDGEVFIRFFVDPNASKGEELILRFVEPEQVRSPADSWHPSYNKDDYDYSFGIITPIDDLETIEAYITFYPHTKEKDKLEYVDKDFIVYLKANTDRTIKRGLPDFIPINIDFTILWDVVRNLQLTSKIQTGVVWIEKNDYTTFDQVIDMIRERPSVTPFQTLPTPSPAGPKHKIPPGTTIETVGNKSYEPGPTVKSDAYIKVVETCLRTIGFRWSYPDWFTEGSKSFASTIVLGSPFVRAVESRQKEYALFFYRICRTFLDMHVRLGNLPPEVVKVLVPQITFPPIVIADEGKQVDIWKKEVEAGVMDPIEWLRKRGRDVKGLYSNYKRWYKLQKKLKELESKLSDKGSEKEGKDSENSQASNDAGKSSPPGSRVFESVSNVKEDYLCKGADNRCYAGKMPCRDRGKEPCDQEGKTDSEGKILDKPSSDEEDSKDKQKVSKPKPRERRNQGKGGSSKDKDKSDTQKDYSASLSESISYLQSNGYIKETGASC